MNEINYRGLSIPRTRLGSAVTSDNLFDPNEQVIFDFYEANRGRYRRALDVGANIGVHSILMARQGWEVRAFEPDPHHYEILVQNVLTHAAPVVETVQAAVSDRAGSGTFVRVLGNTTSSHLAGVKAAYGPRERFDVALVDCRPLFAWADFAKIDCEGHEAALVRTTNTATWAHMDAMLEVGSAGNARVIYDHLMEHGGQMWAQKVNWARVWNIEDVPAHHSEGSMFVGRRPPFPDARAGGVV